MTEREVAAIDALAQELPRARPDERTRIERRDALIAAMESRSLSDAIFGATARMLRSPALRWATVVGAVVLVARLGHRPEVRDEPAVIPVPSPVVVAPAAPAVAPAPTPPEIVLGEGRMRLTARDPMRLRVGARWVEVARGADVEATVRGAQLAQLNVRRGMVVIASLRSMPELVVERQQWMLATEPARAAAPEALAPEEPVAPVAPTAPVTVDHPGERDFRDGLQILLAGNPRAAAEPLERACQLDGPVREDACYWSAVARLRLGEHARAEAALAHVVATWPTSTHAAEARLALGRLLLVRGDRVGARRHFSAVAGDADPKLRAHATRELSKLAAP